MLLLPFDISWRFIYTVFEYAGRWGDSVMGASDFDPLNNRFGLVVCSNDAIDTALSDSD